MCFNVELQTCNKFQETPIDNNRGREWRNNVYGKKHNRPRKEYEKQYEFLQRSSPSYRLSRILSE